MMKSAAISAANAMTMALMSMGALLQSPSGCWSNFLQAATMPAAASASLAGVVQEHLIGLDGEHCDIAGTRGNVPIRKTHRVLAQETRGGRDRAVFLPAGIGGVLEAPARDAVIDHGLPSPAFMPAAVKMRQS